MVVRLLMVLFLVFSCIPLADAEEAPVVPKPMTWADCLREAAANHPDLIAAQEAVVQSQDSKVISGSGRWPQATASASGSSSQSSKSGAGNSFSYGVSASQLVFDGFKSANSVQASLENIKAVQEGFRFTSATVRYRLRSAFINLLKAQEQQALNLDIARIRKSNLDLIELRYQSGMEHKGALLSARANMAQAQFNIDQSQRDLEAARQQLIKEMGRRAGDDARSSVGVTGTFDAGVVDVQKPDLAGLAENNPSLQKISAQKRSAEFSLKANRGDFWPEVSLTGDISRSDTRWLPEVQGSSAGVRVSLPLFEGGARAARLSQSKSAYRQLVEQERSTKDGIMLSLEQAWNSYRDAVETVGVRKAFLSAAQERVMIARQQYTVGLVAFDNWTIIEDDLVNTKRSYLDAQAGALLAEAVWVQAKGETLEYEK